MLEVETPVGTSKLIVITVTGKNLTGGTAIWTLTTLHGLPPIKTKTAPGGGIVISGGANSTVAVSLAAADTTDFAVGNYYWQLFVSFGGETELIEDGTLILTPNDSL